MITTERLILRTFKEEDKDFLFELDNNKIVNRFRTTDTRSMEFCEQQIENWNNWFSDDFLNVYLVELKEKSNAIGLVFLVDKGTNRIELGYRILDDYWNNGYCTEAVIGLLSKYYEIKGSTIYADTHGDNEASIGLLSKVGFKEVEFDDVNNSRAFSLSKEMYMRSMKIYL